MIFVIFFINAIFMGHFTEGKSFTPKTTIELQSALDEAVSQDIIQLSPIDYQGDFVLSASDPSSLITIIGGSGTRILGRNTAFQITSGVWNIQSITIASGDIGIDVKGSGNHIHSLSIQNTRQAIVLEGNDNKVESLTINRVSSAFLVKGSRNAVKSCTVTGVSSYGIKVESGEQNILESNSLTAFLPGAKGFLLEENSSGSVIKSTTVASLSEVRGNTGEFRSITVTGGINIYGCKNAFYSCTMDKVYKTSQCENDLISSNTIGTTEQNPIV